jgi:hypothetical protein
LPSVNKKSYKSNLVATNSIGAGKVIVSGSVEQKIADEILKRADALDMSKSRYAAKILENWFNSGCLPVTKQDEVMQTLKGAETKRKTPNAEQTRQAAS